MRPLLFHGEVYGLPFGVILLALTAIIILVFFLTGAYRKSKLALLLWALGLLFALFCLVLGCFLVSVGVEELYYLYFD